MFCACDEELVAGAEDAGTAFFELEETELNELEDVATSEEELKLPDSEELEDEGTLDSEKVASPADSPTAVTEFVSVCDEQELMMNTISTINKSVRGLVMFKDFMIVSPLLYVIKLRIKNTLTVMVNAAIHLIRFVLNLNL